MERVTGKNSHFCKTLNLLLYFKESKKRTPASTKLAVLDKTQKFNKHAKAVLNMTKKF